MMDNNKPVTIIDLDDTLIKSDLLIEQAAYVLKAHPFWLFKFPFWLLKGRAFLKSELAARFQLDPAHLPYRESVRTFIQEEKAQGKEVALISATHHSLVKQVAAHVGAFDETIGSHEVNLKGTNKLEAIKARYGARPFVYVGDSAADVPLWMAAQAGIAVNPSRLARIKIKPLGEKIKILRDEPTSLLTYIRAIRVHQWAKNVLLFIPIIGSHTYNNLEVWMSGWQAFFAFSLAASSLYILNDLMDLQADRIHPTKKDRPFASGAIKLKTGILLSAGLFFCSLILSWSLPTAFIGMFFLYMLCSIAYSIRFKKIAVLDVVILAMLYTFRIFAGGDAIGIVVTPWLLAYSVFFFFGLALVKRYTEIHRLKERGEMAGRGYQRGDYQALFSLGSASSLLSVVIMFLYLTSQAALSIYSRPERLWLATPLLLYWNSRIWLLALRDQLHDDPVVFAIKDKATWGIGFLFFLVLVISH